MVSSERETNEKRNKESNILRELLGWVVYFVVLIVLCYLLVHFVGQRTLVNGESMEPSLQNGDNLILDKITYRFREPERFETIVFLPYANRPEERYIKRIIGMPGETVQVVDGYVYINGSFLDEHFGAELMDDPGIVASPLILGNDEYFVLGDNRNHSTDSRTAQVGVVHKEQFLGRAWVRIYPFNKIGFVQHQ